MNTRTENQHISLLPKPPWIRGRVSWGENLSDMDSLLRESNLNSVCVEAACPNKGECWHAGHVTFMILGDTCTRSCRFCNVTAGFPRKPDFQEPRNIAKAAKKLSAKFLVITSVTRDDLKDKGAGQFISAVNQLKAATPETIVELLIPDLGADSELLRKIAFSGAKVIGHNIEMPPNLYPDIRPEANYVKSLDALKILKSLKNEGADILIKSSMILGLGEVEQDIHATLEDLKNAGVDIVHMGQYLSPSKDHWPVKKYYTPEEFESFARKAEEIGFDAVRSGPMVRSSYRAHKSYLSCAA